MWLMTQLAMHHHTQSLVFVMRQSLTMPYDGVSEMVVVEVVHDDN